MKKIFVIDVPELHYCRYTVTAKNSDEAFELIDDMSNMIESKDTKFDRIFDQDEKEWIIVVERKFDTLTNQWVIVK